MYWCLTVKYINPMLLYFILISILKSDLAKPYGNYAAYWQAIGWAIPIVGILIFIISIFSFSGEQELNFAEFELYDQMDAAKIHALDQVKPEMTNIKEKAEDPVKEDEDP